MIEHYISDLRQQPRRQESAEEPKPQGPTIVANNNNGLWMLEQHVNQERVRGNDKEKGRCLFVPFTIKIRDF